jgi:hypothetical protein
MVKVCVVPADVERSAHRATTAVWTASSRVTT